MQRAAEAGARCVCTAHREEMRGVALFCSSNWKHDALLCSFFEEGLKEVVPTPPPIKAHGGSPLLMAGVLSLLISVTFFSSSWYAFGGAPTFEDGARLF